MSDAAGPRAAYVYAILDMPAGAKRCAEVRQMLVDLLDVVEQTPDEAPLIAALAAFDEAVGPVTAPGGNPAGGISPAGFYVADHAKLEAAIARMAAPPVECRHDAWKSPMRRCPTCGTEGR